MFFSRLWYLRTIERTNVHAHAPHALHEETGMDGETVLFVIFLIAIGALYIWPECEGK